MVAGKEGGRRRGIREGKKEGEGMGRRRSGVARGVRSEGGEEASVVRRER